MWRAFSFVDKLNQYKSEYNDLRQEIIYPFSVRPSYTVSPFDLMTLHRD